MNPISTVDFTEPFMINSFDWDKGYCTKFLKLWEKYARDNGYSELIVSHVGSDALEHILEKKRCFSFELDECEEKTYHKSLSPDVHHPEENGSSP